MQKKHNKKQQIARKVHQKYIQNIELEKERKKEIQKREKKNKKKERRRRRRWKEKELDFENSATRGLLHPVS